MLKLKNLPTSGSLTSWSTLGSRPLTSDNLDKLLKNELPALLIPGAVSAKDCLRIVTNLNSIGMGDYAHVSHAVGRLGLAQMEFHLKKSKDLYFRSVPDAQKKYAEAVAGASDPLETLMSLLRHVRNEEVRVAVESPFGEMFAGTFRNVKTVGHKHFDFAAIEAKGWAVDRVVRQLSWNVYLNDTYEGGGLKVYNHQYQEVDEAFRVEGQYFYSDKLVENAQVFSYQPKLGDIVIFNSRNIHEVLPVKGERFSLSSFIGEMPDKALELWS